MTTQVRKDAVEKLAKEFIRAFNGPSCHGVGDLPVLAMALADKAYSAGVDDSIRKVGEFMHYGDGRECQTKRYIVESIRSLR